MRTKSTFYLGPIWALFEPYMRLQLKVFQEHFCEFLHTNLAARTPDTRTSRFHRPRSSWSVTRRPSRYIADRSTARAVSSSKRNSSAISHRPRTASLPCPRPSLLLPPARIPDNLSATVREGAETSVPGAPYTRTYPYGAWLLSGSLQGPDTCSASGRAWRDGH
jgi:hypothetical protein